MLNLKRNQVNKMKKNDYFIDVSSYQSADLTSICQAAGTLILLAQQLGLKLPDNIGDVVNTFLTLLVLLGVINDPTTEGISDSPKALTYNEPKKD